MFILFKPKRMNLIEVHSNFAFLLLLTFCLLVSASKKQTAQEFMAKWSNAGSPIISRSQSSNGHQKQSLSSQLRILEEEKASASSATFVSSVSSKKSGVSLTKQLLAANKTGGGPSLTQQLGGAGGSSAKVSLTQQLKGSRSSSGKRPSLSQQLKQEGNEGNGICSCKRRIPLSSMVPVLPGIDPRIYIRSANFMGDGSQAKIFHGYSFVKRRCVAIKISDLSHPQWRVKARSEVDLYKQLSSKNLSHILNMEFSYETPDEKYLVIVMELGDMDLFDYWKGFVAKNHQNPVAMFQETYSIIMDLLEAFVQLHHQAHVTHLDFKPENVMLMEKKDGEHRGYLKLIDFGGSYAMAEEKVIKNGKDVGFRTTVLTDKVGSRDYYAPEQRIEYYYRFVKREDWFVFSNKTDIWAIGSFIYWLLTSPLTYPQEGNAANDVFFTSEANFVGTEVESKDTVYRDMRKYYFATERIKTPQNAGLIYLSRACMHAVPMKRPKAEELLGFMKNKFKLALSRQYNKDVNDEGKPKTYKKVMKEAGGK